MPRYRKASETPFSHEVKFQLAETLQQRAERRGDISLFEQAVAAGSEALQLAAAAQQRPSLNWIADVHFLVAECLQSWAEGLLEVTTSLPDAQLSRAVEQDAKIRAASLFQKAVQHYEQVLEDDRSQSASDTTMRVDAAVNCGNTLAAWAQVASEMQVGIEGGPSPVTAATAMLQRAEALYIAALSKEEDAMTWSNLADALIQHGEILCNKNNAGDAGGELFHRAQEAYSKACGLSSSEQGDDLPGLLLNWGSGLLTAANCAADGNTALSLLEDAAARLRDSIGFSRGDPAPYCALGEVLVTRAEWLQRGGDVPGSIAAVQLALMEGYEVALRIHSEHVDAMVGVAEAKVQRGRASEAMGDVQGARAAWHDAAEAYAAALARPPQSLGSWTERNDVRYNYACALAKSGRSHESAAVLQELATHGGVDLREAAADADLASLVQQGVL
jgi:tetratricopeptide (TPR) repeat protein